MKKALVTGITGQDGSYFAEPLLSKGYEVHGLIRRSLSLNTARLYGIYQDPHASGRRLVRHYGNLNASSSLNRVLRNAQPGEIYNLGEGWRRKRIRFSQRVKRWFARRRWRS